ncbi:MAG: leucyl/phenylalanyl-tRNA--protein transferase [Gammaproteobacteria bacterium]|nr:leucyl/phenylalanyl-tRNA--protein transferase [Gammaproteobacteria bacterium]
MIPWLDPKHPPLFPHTDTAMDEPNGLLAAGGKLSIDWLLVAYRQGIFPWFGNNDPVLWWSPAPRTVLFPHNFHSSRSLTRLYKQNRYHITQNQQFEKVIRNCAKPRKYQPDTWIVEEMIDAYIEMHKAGYAQSIECWDSGGSLQGGVYGIVIDRVFFGESMFSFSSNTSKLCLKYIMECGIYDMLDCQMATSHLMSLGAIDISRHDFEDLLNKLISG